MKNKIFNKSLLILSLLLISSCNSNDQSSSISIENESKEEISVSNEEISFSEEISSISESPSSFIDDDYINPETVTYINAVFEDQPVPDRTLKVDNRFNNATYLFNQEPSSNYPDTNKTKLIDNVSVSSFDTENWVGFYSNENLVIDLCSNAHGANIADIEIHMLQVVSYAIYYPVSIELECSFDGDLYIPLGHLYTPEGLKDSSEYTYRFAFPYTVSANNFRIKFNRNGKKNFLFLDEIRAYDYNLNGSIDLNEKENNDYIFDFYDYKLNKEITTFKKESDSDYDTYQNLALLDGCDVQIEQFDYLTENEAKANSAADEKNKIIDGNKTSSIYNSDDLAYKFAYGKGRNIVVDLGNEMAIDRFKADFLQNNNMSVGVPTAYSISISLDGTNWVSVGGNFTKMLLNNTNQLYQIDDKFEDLYKARYVKLSFTIDGNLYLFTKSYISEIEIFGYKNTTNAKQATKNENIVNGNYPSSSKFGIENILFAPVRNVSTTYCFTKENAIPYLALIDENNEIADRFIDCIAISCNSSTSSSNTPQDNVDIIIEQLFAKNYNLDAINQAMEEVNNKLNTDYKEEIIISLYIPSFDKVDNLSNFLKNQVNKIKQKFDEHNYSNLHLKGFYWNEEYFDETKLDISIPAMQEMNDLIHSYNLISCWCPFYGVDTICYWHEALFDFACLQPNYMFNPVNVSRLKATAYTALVNGMCVEIETEDVTNDALVEKYNEYLLYGINYDYMNTIKMYYQGAVPGGFITALNNNYDLYYNTYLFSKNELDASFTDIEEIDLSKFESKTYEVVHDDTLNDIIANISNIEIQLVETPLYGSFKINLDGSFTYNALFGYQGYDYVTIKLIDKLGNSKEITLTFKVTK